MAALGSVYAEVNSDTTHTGDTNWSTILTASSSNWVANATYFVMVLGICGGDHITDLFHFRFAHGSTPTVFDEAEAIWEMSSASDRRRQEYFYIMEYTVPSTPVDLVFQQKTAVGTNTVKSAHVILMGWRLDADLTEGKDYKYAENSIVDAHTGETRTLPMRRKVRTLPRCVSRGCTVPTRLVPLHIRLPLNTSTCLPQGTTTTGQPYSLYV